MGPERLDGAWTVESIAAVTASGRSPRVSSRSVRYPAETTEAFCDGHNAAVAFFGGVPRSILYDNTKLAVARILGDGKRQRTRVFTELQSHYLGDGKRQRTRVFTELQSHYLFENRFGRPGKGNDKGTQMGPPGGAA